MTTTLRVLHVEDSPSDAKLVAAALRAIGRPLESLRVEDPDAMRAALASREFDLVISDWSMPKFSGPAALKVMQASGADLPFIIVSGTVGEELAVEAMRAGASDYVLKHNLQRLPPAVERELREHASKKARRQAENALRASNDRFRRLSESGIVGIVVADLFGNIHDANDAALQLFGYARDEVLKVKWPDMVPPDWQHQAAETLSMLATRGVSHLVEREMFRKDGSRVPILMGVAMLDHPECIVFVADLTERKRVEASLRISESLKAGMIDDALDAIIAMDAQGKIVAFNPAAERTFGHSRDAVLGRTVAEVIVPERLREEHLRGMQRYFATGAGTLIGRRLELPALRSDGTELTVEMSIARVATAEEPICTAFIRDITDRKRAEEALRVTEAQLQQSQKMEAIGRLAGGIAHDFNNLLSVILSYASIIVEELPPGDAVCGDMQEIEKAARRATELTRQLLAFSRQQVVEPVLVDLGDSIEKMRNMLRRVLGEDVELNMNLSEGVWPVLADLGQVDQILMNLAVNARDAMPTGGKLTIEASNVVVERPSVPGKPSAHVVLKVRDTGVGMDKATQARIFEPFFTTKVIGKGTGLGLATVFGIVRQAGGWVAVESEPGRGATFEVYFPRAGAEIVETALATPSLAPSRAVAGETILVAEDDEQLREVVRQILERRGYRALMATSPEHALSLSDEHQGSIDVLLTDVVMPGMSGVDLARAVVERRPGIKVLYMSGYTGEATSNYGIADDRRTFLQKPITPQLLSRKLCEILGST